MSIDANLLYGISLGFGAGLFLGIIIGGFVMILVSKEVKLPW